MSRTFTVTVPAETRTIYANASGKAEVTYTVTNTRSTPVRGEVHVVPRDLTDVQWATLDSAAVRDFRAGEAQQFKVVVQVPTDRPRGTYNFRLDAANVANKQEDFTEGDTVAVQWAGQAAPVEKSRKGLLIAAIAAAVVLVVGIGIILALRGGVTVPDVVGQTLDNAEANLVAAGLRLGDVDEGFEGDFDTGVVIAQDPGPDSKLKKDGRVDLTLQELRVRVPRAEGPLETARRAIEEVGLVVERVDDRQPGATPGTVLSQDPAPNTPVPPGSTVTLTVQADPEPPSMVRVIGDTLDVAKTKLDGRNIAFEVNAIETRDFGVGRVARQLLDGRPIDEGAAVPAGKTVVLEVSGVRVPRLKDTDKTFAQAFQELRSAGLELGNVRGDTEKKIINQDPDPNAIALQGTSVNLTFEGRLIIIDPRIRERLLEAEMRQVQPRDPIRPPGGHIQ